MKKIGHRSKKSGNDVPGRRSPKPRLGTSRVIGFVPVVHVVSPATSSEIERALGITKTQKANVSARFRRRRGEVSDFGRTRMRSGREANRRSVFLNVPFDQGYEPLFVALISTLVALGRVPHSVLDRGGTVPQIPLSLVTPSWGRLRIPSGRGFRSTPSGRRAPASLIELRVAREPQGKCPEHDALSDIQFRSVPPHEQSRQ